MGIDPFVLDEWRWKEAMAYAVDTTNHPAVQLATEYQRYRRLVCNNVLPPVEPDQDTGLNDVPMSWDVLMADARSRAGHYRPGQIIPIGQAVMGESDHRSDPHDLAKRLRGFTDENFGKPFVQANRAMFELIAEALTEMAALVESAEKL